MKAHQLRKRLKQAQILLRRITVMQNYRMFGRSLEPNRKISNSSTQTSFSAATKTKISSTHCPPPSPCSQPGTSMKPLSRPPVGVSLAVPQVQAVTIRQIVEAQTQNPSQISGIPNYMLSMGNFRHPQNHQPHQNILSLPNPQLDLQQPLQIIEGSVSSSIGPTIGPPEVMLNPDLSVDDMQTSTEDCQQLFQSLRISNTCSPPSPNFSYLKN